MKFLISFSWKLKSVDSWNLEKHSDFFVQANTWNFDSCLGCEDCDCSPASLSESCDVKTGQCQCPEGVTGRRCDKCKAGYFNYSDDGCTRKYNAK